MKLNLIDISTSLTPYYVAIRQHKPLISAPRYTTDNASISLSEHEPLTSKDQRGRQESLQGHDIDGCEIHIPSRLLRETQKNLLHM